MVSFYKGQRLTHLSDFETFLWTKFLEDFGGEYFNFRYDVHLDKPVSFPKALTGNHLTNAQMLAALRIDVVCETKNALFIVELRQDANKSAIGNLIVYRFLYKLQFNPEKEVHMILVTNKYDPQIELACRAIEAQYYVY